MALRDSQSCEKTGNGLEVEPSSVWTFLACSRMTKENCPFPFGAKTLLEFGNSLAF